MASSAPTPNYERNIRILEEEIESRRHKAEQLRKAHDTEGAATEEACAQYAEQLKEKAEVINGRT